MQQDKLGFQIVVIFFMLIFIFILGLFFISSITLKNDNWNRMFSGTPNVTSLRLSETALYNFRRPFFIGEK